MRWLPLSLVLLGSPVCGCARKAEQSPTTPLVVAQKEALAQAEAQPAADEPKKGDGPTRRIRYTAAINLITDDFPKAEADVVKVVRQFKGYVAHSDVVSSPGQPRHGTWRLRIPADAFDDFRDSLLKVSEVEKNTVDSEDLTEEYHDLEQHIKNKLQEEEGWRRLMEKASDKLDTFLAMKKELENVRDYIDRKQAKLKLLANLTDLATVNLKLRERQKFDPAAPPPLVETPTFWMRAGRTFTDSLNSLLTILQALGLLLTALLPWTPVLALSGVATWAFFRRRRRPSPGPSV